MAEYINTNVASLYALLNLSVSQSAVARSLQRLSSGLRINSARDDAAGLAIATRMSSQINGLSQAARNANDGISLLQTASGALSTISDNLQRMRSLAVQAANGTNSASDRQSINNEIQQLSAEIQRVAISTNFNDINLLDGSFNAQSFQVGAYQGNVININSIANMQTSELGSTGSSYTASITGGVTTAALNPGDLTLNGVPVGASLPGVAPGEDASSAFSIATAINAVSLSSSVTATAKPAIVIGSAPVVGAIADFSINGVDIGAVGAGGNAAIQGANLAAAIQGVSAQTGVTASADTVTGAVTMTAINGRNIDIGLNGVAANEANAAANKAAFLSQTGLTAGEVGSQASAAVAAQNTLNLPANVGVGANFIINGVNFTVRNSALASNVVDATHVNLNIPGVNNSAATVSAALTGTIGTAQADPRTSAALSSITAVDGGGTVIVNDNTAGVSGTSIIPSVGSVTHNAIGAAAVTASAASNTGTVTLTSSSVNGLNISGANVVSAGLTTSLIPATAVATIVGINTLNVLTAVNAQNAITSIDSALVMVSAARGSLGAYQNRFTSVVYNIQTAVLNLSASRSRIQDTDFAAETGNLTRARIMQQAGIAMLAQANAAPNVVMALLR